ncbi:uncharacterized protein [Ptychodera flava]|uniref:uncharacterized protein n=1 Tax=Ptychodera flava TaxID=63121 RepID=UPI00396A8CF5
MEVAKQSDVFFSVGPRIFNRYDGKFRGKNVVHMQYIPYADEGFFDLAITPPGPNHPVRILTFGRVDGVGHLKGYDIIAEALSGICKLYSDVNMKCPLWDIVGVPDNKYEESKAFIGEYKKSNFLDYKLHPYCTQQDIMDKLQQSHLVIMPSISEPFGMVGMEAIAAGVPVLMTAHSGLAEFMKTHFGLDGKELVVNVGLDDTDRERDVEKWRMRIIDMLDQESIHERFKKAKQLKEELKSSPEIKKTHEDFMRMLRGIVDIE